MQTMLRWSHRCGGPFVWDLLRGGRTKILMYHGVPQREQFDGVENLYGYNVPLREFRTQLEYLARHCNVLSLRSFVAGEGLSRRRTNVVLTFDDGYENNVANALPELERLQLPATFAITTGFVLDRNPLYNDVVEWLVQRCTRPLTLALTDGERRFDPASAAGRRELYDWVMYECVRCSQEERGAFIDEFARRVGAEPTTEELFAQADYRPMTASQLRRAAEHPLVEIASHSVNHYLLSRARTETKRYELRESKRRLEEVLGRPCVSFCVPGGAWDQEMVDEAYAAGYTSVLTSDVGVARRGERVLKRYGVFRRPVHWFADQVRGPVHEMMDVARRARAKLKTG